MSFILLIGTFALLAGMLWLGLGGRWQLAIPVSSPPILLLLWLFATISVTEPGIDQFEMLAIMVMGLIFLSGWIAFAFGFWISRKDRREALGKVLDS